MKKVFTITYCECGENHVGMEKIGSMASDGFHYDDLQMGKEWYTSRGYDAEIYHLHNPVLNVCPRIEPAYLLVIRNGLNAICNPDDYFNELDNLPKDTTMWSDKHGREVNKHARHNNCFSDYSQAPDMVNKKGTIIDFKDTVYVRQVREALPYILGEKAESMKAEGNYYYDKDVCGIGFHGDGERRRVVGVRVGSSMKLRYRWYAAGVPFGPNMDIILEHGDMYVMSEKAVGTDWRLKTKATLRHAAGCPKYTGP